MPSSTTSASSAYGRMVPPNATFRTRSNSTPTRPLVGRATGFRARSAATSTIGSRATAPSAQRAHSRATDAEPHVRLYSYVVARDYGFAPNPFYGFCTLATCKPDIRRTADIGDWIVGT